MTDVSAQSQCAAPLFNIVLHEPEIPYNTGNIGRTCVALGCALDLIHPLGFELSEKACRRAGLDYWPRLSVREHADWDAYIGAQRPSRLWLFTTKTTRTVFDVTLSRGDAMVFGKETQGLPAWLLDRYPECAVTLPMVPEERSLNLATAVCAAAYEGVRQMLARRELASDASGRLIAGPAGG